MLDKLTRVDNNLLFLLGEIPLGFHQLFVLAGD